MRSGVYNTTGYCFVTLLSTSRTYYLRYHVVRQTFIMLLSARYPGNTFGTASCLMWCRRKHRSSRMRTFKCAKNHPCYSAMLHKAGIDLPVASVVRHRSITVATANKTVGTLCVMTKLQDALFQCDKSQRLSPQDSVMTRGSCAEFYLGQTDPVQ